MADRELIPTRIAYLDLLDERRLVHEGFELLDEKRMLLATRILRGLEQLAAQRKTLETAWQAVVDALRTALTAHGLQELTVWPPRSSALNVEEHKERVFGLTILSADASIDVGPHAWAAVNTAPSIDACVSVTRDFLRLGALVAALEASLIRLSDEFTRTERRARAVENILLPELEADLQNVAAALEALDQEEVVRVHALRPPDA